MRSTRRTFSAFWTIVALLWAWPVTADDSPAETAPPEDSPATGPRVAEAVICKDVQEHQPVGAAGRFSAQEERLICWTRILEGAGETIVHAWIHEGTTRARVELPVRSPSWRTWSSKRLLPSWKGNWEVKIMTKDGAVLQTIPFVLE